jgi:segregation and condensation protein B
MELQAILEALLFSAEKALNPGELRELLVRAAQQEDAAPDSRALRKIKTDDILAALEQLAADHENAGRSYRLVCVAGAWQFVSRPEFAPWVRLLLGHKPRPPRLSQAALETLAIIAYRQPLTRAEIEQVRGVSVDGVMQTLLERELIEQVGRAEVAGRPMTYGTTARFLEYFGLRSIEDLPVADELRRLPIQRPPDLVTVEPGLATAPPADLATPSEPAAGTKEPDPSPATEAATSGPDLLETDVPGHGSNPGNPVNSDADTEPRPAQPPASLS